MLDDAMFRQLLESLRPERHALVTLLAGLDEDAWNRPTECPAYDIKGIASHILGDDLSLLSRQRDAAASGLIAEAIERPGADTRTLLDTFNDRWVRASTFLSADLLVELLAISGEWTTDFFCSVAPNQAGEPVGLFGADGTESPMWQSIAREFLERWVHHSQIRRALDMGSLATKPFLTVGLEIVAAITGLAPSSNAERWVVTRVDTTRDCRPDRGHPDPLTHRQRYVGCSSGRLMRSPQSLRAQPDPEQSTTRARDSNVRRLTPPRSAAHRVRKLRRGDSLALS